MSARCAAVVLVAMFAASAVGHVAWGQTAGDPPKPDPICVKFQRTDRKWCVLQNVRIEGRHGSTELRPGACFDGDQAWFFGTNLADDLNRRCLN